MGRVRSLLAVIFAIAAGVVFLFSPLRLLAGFGPDAGESISLFLLLTAVALAIPAVAVVFAIACWTYWRRTPSARVWGVIASMLLFVIACGTSYFQWRGLHGSILAVLETNFVLLGSGILGIVAFARWESAEQRIPA